MARNRRFSRNSLAAVAISDIRPPMGVGALVWRYVVFLPLSEQKLGDETESTMPFLVYAKPVAASDRYFDRLEQELRHAFNQGVILVERQDAFLFASPQEKPGQPGKRSSSRPTKGA